MMTRIDIVGAIVVILFLAMVAGLESGALEGLLHMPWSR
jgi:hypothetical protein